MRIAIFGAYKSGTTALFYRINQAMPSGTRLLFEPAAYVAVPNSRSELAKVMIGFPPPSEYQGFLEFERKIYLIRDPRDWLISGLLFAIQQNAAIYDKPAVLTHVMEMLRCKEQSPRSVPIHQLMAAIFAAAKGQSTDEARQWVTDQYRWLLSFEDEVGQHFTLRYEDFVDGEISALESFLGLDLKEDVSVAEAHDHVVRTKSYGNWRHWFTDEDVTIFEPIFSAYIQRYGYDQAWTLAEKPVISPEHSTEYVKRTVKKRLAAR